MEGLKDFWEEHPDAEAIEVFRKLKERKKEKSSAIMWYIHHFSTPESQILRLLKPEERSAELKKWLDVDQKDLDLKYVKDAMLWYKINWIEPPAKGLALVTEKIYQADEVDAKFEIDSPERMKLYSEMIAAKGILKEAYDRYLTLFKQRDMTPKKHGGGNVSAADSGKLFEVFAE